MGKAPTVTTLPLYSTPLGVVGRPLGGLVTAHCWDRRYLQNTRATAEEMARVVVGVEADQVAGQRAAQDLVANGEDAVNFRTWEWGVKEKANLDVLLGLANLLAQHLRHEHEVVVVDPHHVVILHILCDRLCEQAVGLAVCLPCGLVEGNLTGVVVEQRPHDGICKLVFGLGKEDHGVGVSLEKPL
jgi:hypothetical protein